ncbi:MAG TPA: permease-like cell division protein FtsX, partial [Acidiferrobacterales bacterium]|nr:permease-like cell division protein FtsX [Acidiferrobacterales bacterium]
QVLLATLGQMTRAPLATLLTLTVIGITLALPSGLFVMLDNLERVSAGWDRGAQASLFLKRSVTEAGARKLAQQIRAMSAVAGVDYISREAALVEFRKQSGFGTALNALDSNPLPAVLVVRLAVADDPAAVAPLMKTLAGLPGVDLAQLDIEWLQRLTALLRLAERAVAMLAVLLSLAVLLIIGNTIRLAVVNRRTEIEIIQLVGGTPGFVRRPFLYSGLLQGMLGGLLAWLLVEASLLLLSGPARELAGLYGSNFALTGLGADQGLFLTLAGALLGWIGSRLAVGWQLRQIALR